MKSVQFFSKEYLHHSKKLSPDEIARFLEDFRLMNERPEKSKLISIKIPQTLLAAFRHKCDLQNVPYQSQIKRLMKEWI